MASAPEQQKMARSNTKTGRDFHSHRNEKVLYNSAKAKRTCLGRWHYCASCPGWNKMTSNRIVYSRWEMTECCCGLKLPCGRQLDQYDSEIIIDASAHQSLMQICRGEGDITLYRLPGADPSDPSEAHMISDVASVFDVFNDTTFELSKINLGGFAGKALGRRMGAVVWDFPAGCEGPAQKHVDMNIETVFYDSRTAKRTWLGWFCNVDCCFPPVYKITSERVMYSDWELWHLCDNPCLVCCCPCYAVRGCLIDICPCSYNLLKCGGVAKVEDEAVAREERRRRAAERSGVDNCCVCPTGRNVYFFDIDLLVDVGAHQRCLQLCVNEGDLQLHRLAGGDADNPDPVFLVRHVPEVFHLFDNFSYELSQMDLSHFRQSALGARMS